jgi:hypothetical protein
MTDQAGQTAGQTGQTTAQTPTVPTSPPWGMVVVLAALILVSAGSIWVLISYQSVFQNPTDVTTVLGNWFTVVGALVGAYFGVKASSDATDKAQGATQTANNTANQALAKLPPETAAEVLRTPSTGGTSTTGGTPTTQ